MLLLLLLVNSRCAAAVYITLLTSHLHAAHSMLALAGAEGEADGLAVDCWCSAAAAAAGK